MAYEINYFKLNEKIKYQRLHIYDIIKLFQYSQAYIFMFYQFCYNGISWIQTQNLPLRSWSGYHWATKTCWPCGNIFKRKTIYKNFKDIQLLQETYATYYSPWHLESEHIHFYIIFIKIHLYVLILCEYK